RLLAFLWSVPRPSIGLSLAPAAGAGDSNRPAKGCTAALRARQRAEPGAWSPTPARVREGGPRGSRARHAPTGPTRRTQPPEQQGGHTAPAIARGAIGAGL